MRSIDLNCDMGEGCGNDEWLLEFVSSANIACGFHAGDASTMRRTVEAALAKNVAIGAHPGYPDKENFGRTNMEMSPREAFDIVVYQIGAMKAICEASGGSLNHVKAHGALYNQAARNDELAQAIIDAVKVVDSHLVLFGLSGSNMIQRGRQAGLRMASEVFGDRTYQADGSLTPRDQPNALIAQTDESLAQVMQMITSGAVTATTGETLSVAADTLCLHGDGEHAVEFARAIRTGLTERGVEIKAISR